MVKHAELEYMTEKYNQLLPIREDVRREVRRSGIRSGVVYVITQHTTTGIMINEKLECLEDDILRQLGRLFPEDGDYYHARFLRGYGAMAGNPTGHLKSMLSGNHCVLPILDGEIVCGRAQEIYLAEFDGPQERTVSLIILGE